MGELLGALAVVLCDHTLYELLQRLLLCHDNFDEGSDVVLRHSTVLQKLDDDARRHLQIVVIVGTELLKDELDHGAILCQ